MIVTIDGPAGAGKSTVARALARRLGFRFLDTGATYRALTLAALRRNVDWNQPARLAELVRRVIIAVDGDRVLLDGEDVTDQIRTSEVTSATRYVADNPQVRERLVELQRQLAGSENVVTEGRDQGTVVFPDAECKIFLTASRQQRARRRLLDLQSQGEQTTLSDVLASQDQRDHRDSTRDVGRLVPAKDAIEMPTDGLDQEEVVDRLEGIVKEKAITRSESS